MTSSLDDIRDFVRQKVKGRKIILTGDGASSFEAKIEQFRSMGAGPFLAICLKTPFNDEVDLGKDVTRIDVKLETDTITFTNENSWNDLFENPPAHIQKAVDDFDPQKQAFFTIFRFRTATHAFGT